MCVTVQPTNVGIMFVSHTSKNKALLVRGDALLVLDFGLDHVDCVRGLDLQGDGLARQLVREREVRET